MPAWESGARQVVKRGASWGPRQRKKRVWEGDGGQCSSRSPSPCGVRRRQRAVVGKGGSPRGHSRPRGRPPSPKRTGSSSRERSKGRGRRDRPPPPPKPGRGETVGVGRAPLPRRKGLNNRVGAVGAAGRKGDGRGSGDADRDTGRQSFNGENSRGHASMDRESEDPEEAQKLRNNLEDLFLAVELLKGWDDRKACTAEDMEQTLSKFLEDDAKKFRISPRSSTEIFLRGMLRTLWDIDRLLREMNPGDSLKKYTKNSPLLLSTLRVCTYRLMWAPSSTVRMVVQAANDLMKKVGVTFKTEQDFISNSVARMMKAFDKGHQEWDSKRKAREELKRKAKEENSGLPASKPKSLGAAVGAKRRTGVEGQQSRRLPPVAKRPKLSAPGLISARADMEVEAGMEDGEAEELVSKTPAAQDAAEAAKSGNAKDAEAVKSDKRFHDKGDNRRKDDDQECVSDVSDDVKLGIPAKSKNKKDAETVDITGDLEDAGAGEKKQPEIIADDEDDEDELEEEEEEDCVIEPDGEGDVDGDMSEEVEDEGLEDLEGEEDEQFNIADDEDDGLVEDDAHADTPGIIATDALDDIADGPTGSDDSVAADAGAMGDADNVVNERVAKDDAESDADHVEGGARMNGDAVDEKERDCVDKVGAGPHIATAKIGESRAKTEAGKKLEDPDDEASDDIEPLDGKSGAEKSVVVDAKLEFSPGSQAELAAGASSDGRDEKAETGTISV